MQTKTIGKLISAIGAGMIGFAGVLAYRGHVCMPTVFVFFGIIVTIIGLVTIEDA